MRSLLLVSTVLVVPYTMAQGNKARQHRGGGGSEMRIERMTEELGLDAGQEARIRVLIDNNKEQMERVRTMENSDERSAAMRANREAMHNGIQEVLTPEQRVKSEALRAERQAGLAEGRGERRGDGAGREVNFEERSEARIQRMTTELGLSTEQVARMKQVDEQHMAKYERIRAMDNEDQRRNAMQDARKSHRAAIQDILTPAQKARQKELQGEGRGKQQRKGRGAK